MSIQINFSLRSWQGASLLLIIIIFIAFWIRIQGVANIPTGQFTGNDGYFYYWQAQLVSEHGRMPERDMNRWVPLGRDLGQTLNLYGYILAYTHKALAHFFPNVSLYQVASYTPPVCFCISIAVLYFFFYHTFGLLSAGIVGILLATFPGAINRSLAGFADRDAWCFLLGVLAVTTYLISMQAQHRRRLIWTLISGFVMFLGGISWEGFGMFLSIILFLELWRFLTTEKEDGLGLYFLWVCIFVPTLFLASPAYRSGYGFSAHLFAWMLMSPVMLLLIRSLRYILLTQEIFAKKLRTHGRNLAFVLALISLLGAIGYVWIQNDTFASTTVPLSQNSLMQRVTELKAPLFRDWVFRYGSVFFLGCLGLLTIYTHHWKKIGTVLSIPIVLFTFTTFFRQILDIRFGIATSNALFSIAIAGCILGFLLLAWHQKTHALYELTYIAFTFWFLGWMALARDARRYDFFIGVPIAFFTAELIQFLSNTVSSKFKRCSLQSKLRYGIAIVMIAMVMFFPPTVAHTRRSLSAATQMRQAKPGDNSLAKAFQWMKAELPRTAVVAARWSYGSQLNVLGGVKTITDQDHFIQHWIELYFQHVQFATSEREILEFLKTHNATHIMLTEKDSKRAFLRWHSSDAFLPVYPMTNFDTAKVKVWEVHYSPDIQPNLKYLETGLEFEKE